MNKDNAKDYLPLVQALADGKVIQYRYLRRNWGDVSDLYEHYPASDYRIKPEPKEIWVNQWNGNGYVVFDSEDEALAHAKRYGIGHATKRYREVIE